MRPVYLIWTTALMLIGATLGVSLEANTNVNNSTLTSIFQTIYYEFSKAISSQSNFVVKIFLIPFFFIGMEIAFVGSILGIGLASVFGTSLSYDILQICTSIPILIAAYYVWKVLKQVFPLG